MVCYGMTVLHWPDLNLIQSPANEHLLTRSQLLMMLVHVSTHITSKRCSSCMVVATTDRSLLVQELARLINLVRKLAGKTLIWTALDPLGVDSALSGSILSMRHHLMVLLILQGVARTSCMISAVVHTRCLACWTEMGVLHFQSCPAASMQKNDSYDSL